MKFKFENFLIYSIAIMLQIAGVYAFTTTRTEEHTVPVLPTPSPIDRSQFVTYYTETHPYTIYGITLTILSLLISSIVISIEFPEKT